MTDFSRFEEHKKIKIKKPRKPIRWGKIAAVLGVVFAISSPTFVWLILDTLDTEEGVQILDNSDSQPSEPAPVTEPSEPAPTGLTFEKLRAFYDTREKLTTIQFLEADAKFKGETVVYYATLIDITFNGYGFDVKYDHGFEWDDSWNNTTGSTNVKDTPEARDKLRLWAKGTRLKFVCIYSTALDSLAMQPYWKSCVMSEE